MSGLTRDIIFATRHVGMSTIRNKSDVKKFIARNAMWRKAWGDPKEEWYPWSTEQVSAHIGMYTNASNLSHKEFLEEIKDAKKRRAEYVAYHKKATKKKNPPAKKKASKKKNPTFGPKFPRRVKPNPEHPGLEKMEPEKMTKKFWKGTRMMEAFADSTSSQSDGNLLRSYKNYIRDMREAGNRDGQLKAFGTYGLPMLKVMMDIQRAELNRRGYVIVKDNPTKRPKLPSTRTPRGRIDWGSKTKKTQIKRIGKRGKSKVRKSFAGGENFVFVASIKSGDIYAGPLSVAEAEAFLSRNKKAWIADNKKHKRRVETGYFTREYGSDAKHFEKEYRPRKKDYILPESHEIVFEWARTAKEMPQWPPYPRRRNPGKMSKKRKTVYERSGFQFSDEEKKARNAIAREFGITQRESPAAKSVRLARDRMEKMSTAKVRALIPKMEKALRKLNNEMEAGSRADPEWHDTIARQDISRKMLILHYKMQTAKEELESRRSKNPGEESIWEETVDVFSKGGEGASSADYTKMGILHGVMRTALSKELVWGQAPYGANKKHFDAVFRDAILKKEIKKVTGGYRITPKGLKAYMKLDKEIMDPMSNPRSKKKASKKGSMRKKSPRRNPEAKTRKQMEARAKEFTDAELRREYRLAGEYYGAVHAAGPWGQSMPGSTMVGDRVEAYEKEMRRRGLLKQKGNPKATKKVAKKKVAKSSLTRSQIRTRNANTQKSVNSDIRKLAGC